METRGDAIIEIPDIPPIKLPPFASTIVFGVIVFYVVACLLGGVFSAAKKHGESPRKSLHFFAVTVWLIIGAVLPLSGLFHWKVLPPPGLIFPFCCFLVGIGFALSRSGKLLASLPLSLLIGFQVFRFPLELVLHYWYEVGTIPIQMTYEGLNFDIITGVLALIVAAWAKFGTPPKALFWVFNIVGLALLITVVSIAITSVPTPFRQFENDSPLLLPFYFPYSYIVSVAVTGALIGHVVLFRKLLSNENAHRSN